MALLLHVCAVRHEFLKEACRATIELTWSMCCAWIDLKPENPVPWGVLRRCPKPIVLVALYGCKRNYQAEGEMVWDIRIVAGRTERVRVYSERRRRLSTWSMDIDDGSAAWICLRDR